MIHLLLIKVKKKNIIKILKQSICIKPKKYFMFQICYQFNYKYFLFFNKEFTLLSKIKKLNAGFIKEKLNELISDEIPKYDLLTHNDNLLEENKKGNLSDLDIMSISILF